MSRRRRRALGAPRHVHAERAETDRAHVQYAIASANQAIDMARQGDVYSCSTALHRLIEAGDANGSARANDRSRGQGPTENRELRAAMDRYKQVCQAPRNR